MESDVWKMKGGRIKPDQARAKVNAGGRKQERKIRRGASEEGGMDGWLLPSSSGEA